MVKRVGFLFAGQGAQAVGMGRDLAETSVSARKLFASADKILGWDLAELCYNGPLESLTASSNCQPAIYTVSLAAMAAFQERHPVSPVACAGLSLGEFSALTAAGALDFDQGLQLVAQRGALMDAACRETDGAMAAVLNTDFEVVQDICRQHQIDVANCNCPGQIVISGPVGLVATAVDDLQQNAGAKAIMLQVDGAFHSRLMQSAADGFAPILAHTHIRVPQYRVAQNFVGTFVDEPEHIRRNLSSQVTGTVRWEACVRTILAAGVEALIEFGPGSVLTRLMRKIDPQVTACSVGSAVDIDKAAAMLGLA